MFLRRQPDPVDDTVSSPWPTASEEGEIRRGLRGGLVVVTITLALLLAGSAGLSGEFASAYEAAATPLILLPLVSNQEEDREFSDNAAIWAHPAMPTTPEVVLFRDRLPLTATVSNAVLQIFADTRYEVWLDGQWQGRGPARFSRTLHEVDQYALGDLPAGDHLLAVLVQWAPNIRRAESVTPHLLAHIEGQDARGRQIIARTGPAWKAKLATAWRADAAPVHRWNLLGPTELVDLRQLPADWMQPEFRDADWLPAVVKPLDAEIHYALRSIPPLSQVPFTATVIEAGLLSPGRWLAQVTPAEPLPFHWQFTTNQAITFTVETLSTAQPQVTITPGEVSATVVQSRAGLMGADAVASKRGRIGQEMIWTAAGPQRPDVQVATVALPAGVHTLAIDQQPSPHGLLFSVGPAEALVASLPFTQGNHAGQRLLLAEPVSAPNAVLVSPAAMDLSLTVQMTTTPAYLVLDLGRVVHGRLVVTPEGPGGTVIDIGWDERLITDTLRPLPFPGSLHPEWNQVDSWVLDGAARTISTIDARAGRYVLVAVWGDAPVTLRDLHIDEERYPVTQRGWFRSSNPRLDAIWQLGVNTAYPSMQDAYADPWRERGQWWGDAYVTDHINQVAFGDTALLRRGLLFMAASFHNGQPSAFAPNGDASQLLDYSMLWAQSLQDYIELTDDVAFATEVYPALQTLIDHLASRRHPVTGLLDIPVGHWSQSALIDWAGSASRHGQSTPLNALYYGTLLDAAAVADRVGDAAAAATWRAQAATLRAQIEERLFLPDQQAYAATILNGEVMTPTSHAQAWPLAFGVTAPARTTAVVDQLLRNFKVEIYGMFWVLKGLGERDEIEPAVALIEQHYGRLLDKGATTLWESWTSDRFYRSALSHSWGGGPTWFLSTYVLGAQRQGSNGWLVRPAFAGVAHAAGAIPLATGELVVAWTHQPCEYKTLTVKAPPTSRGEIRLGAASVSEVVLDRETIWSDGKPLAASVRNAGGEIVVDLPGGDYELALQVHCDQP